MLPASMLMSGCESMGYYASSGCDVFRLISAHAEDDVLTKQQILEHNVRYRALCE